MRETAYTDALGKIAWGYLLIHLNLNLGTVDVLPNWLGCLFLYQSLHTLGQREPSALLLKPFGHLLTLYEVALWSMTMVSYSPPDLLELLFSVIALYFHFQLLTNLANIAQGRFPELSRRLLQLRNVRTVLCTVLFLPIPWDEIQVAAYLLVIVSALVGLVLCVTLFSYRKLERERLNRLPLP